MSKFLIKKLATLLVAFPVLITNAQDSLNEKRPEMADALRSNGKIYVVVAVLVVILLGLFFYLISLDRKISGLEK
ncbi:MAG TPA: hypothetical protein VKR32_17220 [Puia sp.]|nr:hypothetical protein [Puia sp.]